MKKLKIYFAGLYQDDNLGDPVIARCTEGLYTSKLPIGSYEVGHISINHFCFNSMSSTKTRLLSINRKLGIDCLNDWLIKKEYEKYFKEKLKDADAVIVVGGGLIEFTGGRFADGLLAITLAGNKYKFPVIINATGVEGYDESNKRCLELKEMLHQRSVRYVSTRDDLETLINNYFDGHPTVTCKRVSDPAVWASEVFGITKQNTMNLIGLGVVRKNIFKQYGLDISESGVIKLYTDVYLELRRRGHDVAIFTNGTNSDNDSAIEVLKNLRERNCEVKTFFPNSDKELLEVISNFSGVIAGRLHSCIISYSLNIPAVGLVWNDKLKRFGEEIQKGERFISTENLNPTQIADQLECAMKEGYDQIHKEIYRNTIIQSIDACINDIIKPLLL